LHYHSITTHAAGPPGVCARVAVWVCVCVCMCVSVCVYVIVCVMKLVQRQSLCRAAAALPVYNHTRSWASSCVRIWLVGCVCMCVHVCACVSGVCVYVCQCVCDEISLEAVLVQSSCCITVLLPHTHTHTARPPGVCACGWLGVFVYVRACVFQCVCMYVSVCV